MKTALMLVTIGLLLGGTGCRRYDWRTLTIQVPDMRGETCARIVQQALADFPGLKQDSLTVDLEAGTVTLTYNSLLAADKNAEYRVADAGFAVVSQSRGTTFTIPANPEAQAALPPECRP